MEKARQYSALIRSCGRLAFLSILPCAVWAEDPLAVPSGQPVTFVETIGTVPGPDGLTARFRFLAPEIGGAVDFDTASADMAWLCQTYALPRIAGTGPQPAQVVISLADRPVAFGDSDPEVVQFFEAYRVTAGRCEPEAF